MINIVFPATGCLVFFSMTSSALARSSGRRCHEEVYTYLTLEPGYYNFWGYWEPSQYVESTGFRYICDENGVSTCIRNKIIGNNAYYLFRAINIASGLHTTGFAS